MHDESGFANLAGFKVQPRFTVVLPPWVVTADIPQRLLHLIVTAET